MSRSSATSDACQQRDLAQDEDGPLPRRQVPEAPPRERDERTHARALPPRGFPSAPARTSSAGPCRKGMPLMRTRLAGGDEVDGLGSTLTPPSARPEEDVCGDPVEPRAERRASLEALEAAPSADEGLLHGVLRLARPEHPPAVRSQLGTVFGPGARRGRWIRDSFACASPVRARPDAEKKKRGGGGDCVSPSWKGPVFFEQSSASCPESASRSSRFASEVAPTSPLMLVQRPTVGRRATRRKRASGSARESGGPCRAARGS